MTIKEFFLDFQNDLHFIFSNITNHMEKKEIKNNINVSSISVMLYVNYRRGHFSLPDFTALEKLTIGVAVVQILKVVLHHFFKTVENKSKTKIKKTVFLANYLILQRS